MILVSKKGTSANIDEIYSLFNISSGFISYVRVITLSGQGVVESPLYPMNDGPEIHSMP
jgi:hypothetical protein